MWYGKVVASLSAIPDMIAYYEHELNEAKKEYDYIIVDTAPTILVTDTLLISQLADLTIYMTRANFTEKKILAFSGELHEQKKLINIAYVINDVGAGEAYGYGYGYGYGYKYSYNYGYGYGYSEDNEGSKKSKPFWKRLFSKA
jgi:Mrp family chromosome partitioning ATPase